MVCNINPYLHTLTQAGRLFHEDFLVGTVHMASDIQGTGVSGSAARKL